MSWAVYLPVEALHLNICAVGILVLVMDPRAKVRSEHGAIGCSSDTVSCDAELSTINVVS